MIQPIAAIANFKTFLNETKMNFNNSTTQTLKLIENIKNGDASPDSREDYDQKFDYMIKKDNESNRYISQLSEIKGKIDDLIDTINSSVETNTELKRIINNQQLRSGLQGISKQIITENASINDILNYPDPIKRFVADKFVDTPYNKKGGRSRNKRSKRSKRNRSKRS